MAEKNEFELTDEELEQVIGGVIGIPPSEKSSKVREIHNPTPQGTEYSIPEKKTEVVPGRGQY